MSGKILALMGALALIYLGFYLSRRSKKGFRVYLWIIGTTVALNTIFMVTAMS